MPNHVSSDRKYVHLIKASAGSGKTHHLTGEYLHLLFSKPNNHSHILAVTFTNKATDEMKSRIVEELSGLASGKESPYLEALMVAFSMSDAHVRSQAGTILETILHDYSAFSISTIDRFFQRTMRAFTREMGLAGGFNIEVDETSLLMETIDLMLSELDKPENKTLSDWLLKFMQDRIEEGKSWKIDQQVQDLSKQLFNETYKSLSDEDFAIIQDKTYLANYKQMLMRIVKSYEQGAKMIGVKALNLMEQHGLAYDDFKHKRNSGFMLFVKLSNGIIEKPSNRLIGLADNADLWISSNENEDAIRSAYSAGLNECVHSIIQLSRNDRDYLTAKQLLRNFFTLGILNDIKLRLRKLQQENNTLFLSDTTELLNDIIAGTDSPFIYEKTGTLLTNFMIDEFQDTSRMQWDNFKPLIEESLASNNFNLIVGDVKQSIYRFRNSDWRLLEEQVENDLHGENIQKHLLNTNWRSDANIIQFYNAFFTKAATILQDDFDRAVAQTPDNESDDHHNWQIADAYADVYQNVPKNKTDSGGQVKITFLKCDKGDDWKSKVLEQLPHEIESLQDQGFALKDIAIVVRWNYEATEVAETLLNYKGQHPGSPYRFDIISNEALLIGNAQSVKAVIALMRHFSNPHDKTRLMMAVYEFYRFHRSISPDEALQNFREEAGGDFPDEIRSRLNELSSLPFYDMVESFFALSGDALDEKENAHVQAFLDIALRFSTKASSDLNDFLDWWDEKGSRKALFSPDDQDAIRLITIHKSKGLGFGVVIMPFADWDVDHKATHNNIIWCKPKIAPFDALSVAPLKYGKALAETIFRDDYLEEKRFTYIDNLNLLYVAFTRTKHRLIVFAPQPGKPETITTMADLLWRSMTDIPDAQISERQTISLVDHFTEGDSESIFEYGKPGKKEADADNQSVSNCQTGKWQSIPFDNRLKLRLNSIGFFSDDGSRDYGMLMHDIVSRVKYVSDIPAAVERKISEGELNERERERTIGELGDFLSLLAVSDWYTNKYIIINETQLLHPRFGFSRPDRVMIGNDEVIVVDYKFGEQEDRKYIRQVERYVKTIEEMGYPRVKGFVFYVRLGKTVLV
jgi:ATP-dependent exoDNAse (exonuclease V) beta subunit